VLTITFTITYASQRGKVYNSQTISQKIIDLEEQKYQIEQEIMKNESTLADLKQKAASIAQFSNKNLRP
jgi:phage shock protein A